MIDIAIYIILFFHVVSCVLLSLIILMQRPKSEGLGAAFGGQFTESIFGSQTSDVLVKFTIWLGVIFFSATMLLAVLYAHRSPANKIQQELLKPVTPITQPAVTNSVPASSESVKK